MLVRVITPLSMRACVCVCVVCVVCACVCVCVCTHVCICCNFLGLVPAVMPIRKLCINTWAYGKAGNGNEMETGNRNWKWKVEAEMKTKDKSLVQCFLHRLHGVVCLYST